MKYSMKPSVTAARKKRQGGNSIIEFCLCATVMLTLACGISDFARLFNLGSMAVGAASAGLSYASIGPEYWSDYTDIQAAALADTGNYPGATATASNFCTCGVGGAQTTCPATCNNGTPQQYVQVSVTIPFVSTFNYPYVPNPINITQTQVAPVQ